MSSVISAGDLSVGEVRVFARICFSSKLEHTQSVVETVMKSTTNIVVYRVTNVGSTALIV